MITFRHYRYVGPPEKLTALPATSTRAQIRSASDVLGWIEATHQPREADDSVIATFIIALDGYLWINDRRSEHVLCAAGQPVLSAGEITFTLDKNTVEVTEITNQSTGYCPEPESWSAIASALTYANIPHPPDFTTAYLFRRCDHCGTTNIIKDNWFVCAVCQSSLAEAWNYE